MPTGTDEEVEAAALSLFSSEGCSVTEVLVKLGSKGSMLAQKTLDGVSITRQQVIKAEKVVDTTGAGDCFTAAYAVSLLQGLAPQDCLYRASAAASICVTRMGAMTSLPTQEEVESFLASL